MNRTEANLTFYYGGYYKYKIPNTDLTFYGLNTMYYKEGNKCSYSTGDEQLKWLKNNLIDHMQSGTKAVLGMHVFPG
jgi:hypothetical protein